MGDVEMDSVEPSDEIQKTSIFKTPMIVDSYKLRLSCSESSGYVSLSPSSSPELQITSRNSLCSAQCRNRQAIHRNEVTSDDVSNVKVSFSPPSSSLRINFPKSLEVSADSGIDSASFSGSSKDLDEELHLHPSPAYQRFAVSDGLSSLNHAGRSSPMRVNFLKTVEVSPDLGIDTASFYGIVKDSNEAQYLQPTPVVQRLGVPGDISSLQKAGNFFSGSVETAEATVRNLWQSTPLNSDVKSCRPKFEDSCDIRKSPSKRRKPSLRKSSRDLFQSSHRKAHSVFPQPLLWENPSSSSSNHCMKGKQYVDFLYYLGRHATHQPALDAILGYLEPADLCRASLVSQSWKNVIDGIPSAFHRKRDYVDKCIQIKENLHQSVKKAEGILPFRGQLIAIQNLTRSEAIPSPDSKSPPVSPSKAVFNLYLKEGRKLESGQTLVQCPQCKLPSRKETLRSARCTRRGCQYHFCVLCLCKFHGDKSCPVSTVRHRKRQTAIGSRESRRNLQRLCK